MARKTGAKKSAAAAPAPELSIEQKPEQAAAPPSAPADGPALESEPPRWRDRSR